MLTGAARAERKQRRGRSEQKRGRGVQMVLGSTKRYCRRMVYGELGIEPVPVRAARARMRAIEK